MDDQKYLLSMESDPNALAKESRWRKKTTEEISVYKRDLEQYLKKGYVIAREMTRKSIVKREWPHKKQLANRVWLLFYKLGYSELSTGYDFEVVDETKDGRSIYRDIDVLAKDDETAVVTVCKSSEIPIKESLTKDIDDYSNAKSIISHCINKQYQNACKPKIIWLIVTHNIIWSELDRQYARKNNLHVITEKELRYYLQVAEHLKSAARYQILAEFLKDQKIPALENVTVPAIRGKLGGHLYYSFVSTPEQLLKISFVNHRSLNDPEGAPSYQRLISKTRLRDVSKFIQSGGYFPTNILINFTKKCRFDRISQNEDAGITFGNLYLPSQYRSAWIIDGQHRLYGYAPLDKSFLKQNIMVIAFEELDKTEEANLFVTINHEQKSVSKTLLDELEGELKWGSDKPNERIGAICSRLISLLNEDMGEPFYRKVTQQGIPPSDETCLTIPELKNGLKRSGLIGSVDGSTKEYIKGALSGETDSETLQRAREALNSFFDIIRSSNPALWDAGRKGILCTNISLQGYLLLLNSLIQHTSLLTQTDPLELDPLNIVLGITEYLYPVRNWLSNASIETMNGTFKVQYGSGGPKEYYFRLCQIVNKTHPNFNPEEYQKWINERSIERVEKADRQIKELNIAVQKTIFDQLKEIYGTENNAYWRKGVQDKGIKKNAYTKSLEEEDQHLPLENYLEFIEYKKIVEQKDNWPVFKNIFDIPEPHEKGRAKNLKWMEKINELRRIQAHPTENRSYKMEDYDYLDYIHDTFVKRVSISLNEA
ncbi:DGQHR domain-containing protein [Eggerthella sp. NSJ-70]|uniref:DGQHR domain-containing protein n=1 Tax=Eggerthella hominis TaxID=2763043 RepID=A0ABR7BP99_9ACTN|nr:DGQHR domain-containing protein [Eggerthella hominis]MBC5583409.1 DGQHR domain-containing protein [Eggerthella hominis]